MRITIDEVHRVAALAHLAVPDELAERLRADLDQILDYIAQLDEVDTSSVAPALGFTEEISMLRADEESAVLAQDDALRNAPESGEGHFKTPRALPG
ncbi:MAG: Asp-tRNA(Asn)/Glu-tRNA(Gln) amidotransferase subunit GatC [Acidobacteria bacterium]|nr:Asp-tRNA(Asn)/Glu-tRNA(Gln) amidotransferase subunit GatC [Acidobacteriota bacterium]